MKKKRKHKPIKYRSYIQSEWWEFTKSVYYRRYGKYCKICSSKSIVQLHHIYYGNYGYEKPDQLISFCLYHHKDFHSIYGRGQKDFRKSTKEYIEYCKSLPVDN